MNANPNGNGKDLSNTSNHSGTTGLNSGGKSNNKKKHAIFIKGMYLVRECIYKGQFHNTYKVNCIPRVLYQGEEKIHGSNYFVRVTEAQGPSIKILFTLMGNQLNLTTICLFAIQMLGVLEEIHKSNVIHRNIKPRKIIINNDLKSFQLFLLDLKYAKKYKHKNGQLVRYNENSRIGNKTFCNKFSSVGAHLGISPSRKDDMESLGYIFIYFFRKGNMFGSRKFKQKEEKLKFYEEWKLSIIPEMLSLEMPPEFVGYLNYVKSMNILDPPEYDIWKKTFKSLLFKQGISLTDAIYEWIPQIKNDIGQQQADNRQVLKNIETPTSEANQSRKDDKRNKSISGMEREQRNKSNTNQTNVTSNTAAAPNNTESKDEEEENSQRQVQSKKQEDLKIDNLIAAAGKSKDNTDANPSRETNNEYHYGPIELDKLEQNVKSANQSSYSFGGDGQVGSSSDRINNFRDNGKSDQSLQNLKIKNSQDETGLLTKQSISPKELDDQNNSSYSTDDLSIRDDESMQSLATHLMKQPEVLQQQPLIFRHKQ